MRKIFRNNGSFLNINYNNDDNDNERKSCLISSKTRHKRNFPLEKYATDKNCVHASLNIFLAKEVVQKTI